MRLSSSSFLSLIMVFVGFVLDEAHYMQVQ